MSELPSIAAWPDGWWAVCRGRDLADRPLAVTIHGTPIVLFRSGQTIGALEDRCPHRMVPMSAGRLRQDELECPYHGWRYDAAGCCKATPGLVDETPDHPARRLPAASVQERNGLVWVTKNSVSASDPYLGPLAARDGHFPLIWKTQAAGNLADVAENFLDGFHTHYVHAGLIRKEGARRPVTARIHRTQDRVEIEYIGEGKQSGVISQWFERERASSFARFILPGVAELEYTSPNRTELTITAYFTPSQEDRFLVHAVVALKGGPILGLLKQLALAPFFALALWQDQKIVRLQRETIRRWGGPKFVSTRLDVMRPHMERLLKDGPQAGQDIRHETTLFL
ncbi:Rieske (2Fe-2S) domain protein [Rhodospirillaceae bacterium LM-1]|nr:Rieske (2Fe-2S) domain protein [Rhodospirillaceae bacterium LM-1]